MHLTPWSHVAMEVIGTMVYVFFFVYGNLLIYLCMRFYTTEKVVVLSPSGKSDGNKNITSEDKDIEIDIDNVLVTATIERLLHPVQPGRIIVELHQETEIHYLRPKLRINPRRFDPFLYNRNRTATFLYAPAFVEGKGFCSASLTFLL